jgi:osmotically-inducible protein OsmY
MLSATQIEHEIESALAVDPVVADAAIDVDVRSGRVLLRGTVDTLAAARAAAFVAAHAPGVAYVDDELVVSVSGDDAEIAADAAAALRETPETAALGLEIRCDRGVVVLDGRVETFAERIAAEQVVAAIAGVQAIMNEVRVTAGEVAFAYDPHPHGFLPAAERFPRAGEGDRDEGIASAIEAELGFSRHLVHAKIEVSVNRGVATLTGVVDTFEVSRAAIENAYEGGATTVVDRLVVTGERAGSPESTRPGDVVFGRE